MGVMKIKSFFIVILIDLIITTGVVFAQGKITTNSFQEDLEKLMLEKNVPALGVGIIEDGVCVKITCMENSEKIRLLPTMQSSMWPL